MSQAATDSIRTQAVIDRLPPQNPEAEEAVIGSCLTDPEAILKAQAVLRPGDFYRDRNRVIYEAMVSLSERHEPVDFVTVTDELQRSGRYQEVGGLAYLSHCSSVVPTGLHVEHYAEIVQRCATKRRLIAAAAKMAAIAYDDSTTPEEDVARCWKLLDGIQVGGEKYPALTPDEIQAEFLGDVADLALKGETGIPSGFVDLDRMIGGFEPAQLIILIAVTSLGKSAWALSLSRQVGRAGHPVLYCSVEMTREQLEWRLAAALLGVSAKELRRKVARGIDVKETSRAIERAAELMGESNLHLWYKPNMTTVDIRTRALEWKQRHGISLVVVDYLQILHMEKGESKRVQVANTCHELKALAGEAGLPVVALCQVNRESVKNKQDRRPTLFDASETGSVEQDSDILLGLYRDDFFYRPKEGEAFAKNERGQIVVPGRAELIILKNRDGATGTIDLTWRPATAEYVNYQPEAAR